MDKRGGEWLFKDLWGFTQLPPESMALPFGKAILVCAYGDGTLAPEERAWVIGYFAALGYSESLLCELECYDPVQDADNFARLIDQTMLGTQPDVRLSLIYDGIRAASADRILDTGELATIKRLAALIGITADTVDDIIAAYAAEVNAKVARIMLCFPAGLPF